MLDTIAVPAPNTLFRVLGSESVLLELERGLYFGLNEVATIIWQAFERQLTLRNTLDLLEASFSEDRGHLEEGLKAFVLEVLDADLVELRSSEKAP